MLHAGSTGLNNDSRYPLPEALVEGHGEQVRVCASIFLLCSSIYRIIPLIPKVNPWRVTSNWLSSVDSFRRGPLLKVTCAIENFLVTCFLNITQTWITSWSSAPIYDILWRFLRKPIRLLVSEVSRIIDLRGHRRDDPKFALETTMPQSPFLPLFCSSQTQSWVCPVSSRPPSHGSLRQQAVSNITFVLPAGTLWYSELSNGRDWKRTVLCALRAPRAFPDGTSLVHRRVPYLDRFEMLFEGAFQSDGLLYTWWVLC